MSYQWQVSKDKGTSWSNVSGGTDGTTASYTTPATDHNMNDWQYRCVITTNVLDVEGKAESNAATLTVISYVDSISLDKTEMILYTNRSNARTGTLVATVQPSYASDTSVTWSSTDEAVATVDANGLVKDMYAKMGFEVIDFLFEYCATWD